MTAPRCSVCDVLIAEHPLTDACAIYTEIGPVVVHDRWSFIELWASNGETYTAMGHTPAQVLGAVLALRKAAVSGSPHGAHAYNVEPLDEMT